MSLITSELSHNRNSKRGYRAMYITSRQWEREQKKLFRDNIEKYERQFS
jgi:hypothetical protein